MNARSAPALTAAKHTMLLFVVFLILFPLYVIIVTAFKSQYEFAHSGVFELPKSFLNFDNFRHVLTTGNIMRAFRNTFTIIIVSVTLNTLLATMACYTLGRFQFRMKKYIIGSYIVVSFIPSITTQVATFTVVNSLGFFNTMYAPMILYMGMDLMQLYIYLQFVRSIPYDLDENAMMEGASQFRIYRSIILPLLTPAIATLVIIKSIGIYNDFFIPYLYMPARELGVVSTTLNVFVSNQTAHWHYISAAILAIMIPLIVLYLFAQRYIFAGLVTGAVK